jgi:hypothetical protein
MFRIEKSRWFIVFLIFLFLFAADTLAKRPKVSKKEGHISPVTVEVKFPGGESKKGPLIAFGSQGTKMETHLFIGVGTGDEKVSVWLDSIQVIKDTTEDDLLLIYKNGNKERLEYTIYSKQFFLAREDGGESRISFSQIDSMKFLKPPRMDKDGHAMFDNWLYSPYTGEELTD